MHCSLHGLAVITLDIPQYLPNDCINSSIPHRDSRHFVIPIRVEKQVECVGVEFI
jgi:hypothetical protein